MQKFSNDSTILDLPEFFGDVTDAIVDQRHRTAIFIADMTLEAQGIVDTKERQKRRAIEIRKGDVEIKEKLKSVDGSAALQEWILEAVDSNGPINVPRSIRVNFLPALGAICKENWVSIHRVMRMRIVLQEWGAVIDKAQQNKPLKLVE